MPDSVPPDSFVLDASVVAKLHFAEAGSELAEAVTLRAERLIAPDLIYAEMASIAAKKVRRGVTSRDHAAVALGSLRVLLDEAAPLAGLADRAFDLAVAHGFSAYDGAYLALAEMSGLAVLTADLRLARRASDVGLGHLVHPLA